MRPSPPHAVFMAAPLNGQAVLNVGHCPRHDFVDWQPISLIGSKHLIRIFGSFVVVDRTTSALLGRSVSLRAADDGGLLLLLPYLLQLHKVWKGCNVRVFTICDNEQKIGLLKSSLEDLLTQLRLPGSVLIANAYPLVSGSCVPCWPGTLVSCH